MKKFILFTGLISVLSSPLYVLAVNSNDAPPKPIIGLGLDTLTKTSYAVYNTVPDKDTKYTCVLKKRVPGEVGYPTDMTQYKPATRENGCNFVPTYTDKFNNQVAAIQSFDSMLPEIWDSYVAIKAEKNGVVTYSDPRYIDLRDLREPHANIALQQFDNTKFTAVVDDYAPQSDAYDTKYSCAYTNKANSTDPKDYTDLPCNVEKGKDNKTLTATVETPDDTLKSMYFVIKVSGWAYRKDPVSEKTLPTQVDVVSNTLPFVCNAPTLNDFFEYLIVDNAKEANYSVNVRFKSNQSKPTSMEVWDWDNQIREIVSPEADDVYVLKDLISHKEPSPFYDYRIHNVCKDKITTRTSSAFYCLRVHNYLRAPYTTLLEQGQCLDK